ncbi:hypothetical protein HanPI659440_Chr11g0440021 [Helianthus annuus]|nr:hypothetical protein HanPI659440_Chr11g0440021 [Helianthus annuus]
MNVVINELVKKRMKIKKDNWNIAELWLKRKRDEADKGAMFNRKSQIEATN